MAGNQNSGRNVTFALSEKELAEHIQDYKNRVKSGEIPRASWPHFCSSLDCTEKEIAAVMQLAGDRTSAYHRRGAQLNKMATWVRGQMLSGSGWCGQNQSKAIFALKQNFGDDMQYCDSDKAGNTGPIQVQVSFGGDDRRGKAASK